MKTETVIEVTLCLRESLFGGEALGIIERVLRSETGTWGGDICIWRDEDKERQRVNRFAEDVKTAASIRGETSEQMLLKHGFGPYARRTGSVELRGADESLIAILTLDDYLFAPSGGRWMWGNTLSIQVLISRQIDAVQLARRFLKRACEDLSPLYGRSHLIDEWDAKNISREGGGVMAVGLDVSRYLPGIYWMNFFGAPYCGLIGRERLKGTPAPIVEEIDSGVLIGLSLSPLEWRAPEYRLAEEAVLRHVGQEYFFRKDGRNLRTVAPDFDLEPLPRHPRFS